jgi:hypothetical protein
MTTRCVLIREDGEAEFINCNGLSDYQDAVGGLITSVYSRLLPPGTTVFANDEGILLGLEHNPIASLVVGTNLFGPVVFAGPANSEGETTSVTEEVIEEILGWAGFID